MAFQKAIDCSLLSIMPIIFEEKWFDREVAWYATSPGMPWKAYHHCRKTQYY